MAQPSPSDRLRDRGLIRREAFLKAARTVFLENGYEAASVNDIVRLAGGSLATLYSQFGNKEGLFLAVAKEQHGLFSRDSLPDGADELGFEDYLQAFGESFLRAALSREHLAFYRIFIGEGRKFPQLLQTYLSSGAAELRRVLGGRIGAWAEDNKLTITNVELKAAYFVDLCRTRFHYQALSDSAFAPSDAQIREHVAQAVAFFVAGLRACTR
jgi:AcrR family transcriptional regulator